MGDLAEAHVAATKAKKQQLAMQRAQRERDAWIHRAASEGMSTRDLAQILGLSHQRVAQIIRGE